jgi:hypothetical protein
MSFVTLLLFSALSSRAEGGEARELKSIIVGGWTIGSRLLDISQTGENLLQPTAWTGWHQGFERQDETFICDNGSDAEVRRGVFQQVDLNQTTPAPIVAIAWSKAEAVGGSADADYSLYLDLVYMDGTPLWGQVAPFSVGTHDWERREVVLYPEKPVKTVFLYMLLRKHTGKAWFKDPELRVVKTPEGAAFFDGRVVVQNAGPSEGLQICDVAVKTGFVRIEHEALSLRLECRKSEEKGAAFFDVTLTDTTGKDRAVTLVYAVPIQGQGWRWLHDPVTVHEAEPGREYMNAGRFAVAGNGRISRYPFGAMACGARGVGLAIDMDYPAFYRIGYSAGTGEFFLAYDIGLVPEKPSAHVRFCRFEFDAAWEFRAALASFYGLFPEHFKRRVAEQGNWMPFAKISAVEGWEDFGFKFKEGNDETPWDDAHGIITFRYTEPMTWWMPMPKEGPRTLKAALAEAARLVKEKDDPSAKALFTSGYHDQAGHIPALFQDTPWCNGAVWSMNSSPDIPGDFTDFKNKWNPSLRASLYGPARQGDLDGEYIDSSEGYVTDELDFRRDHFAASATPLTFSRETHGPAVFRGLIAFEYVRAIAQDVHGMNKVMMANATPINLCWLAPLLDVMGTETNWNPEGKWQPMSISELMYRRALCKGKPFCFLMNANFDQWPYELTEKYMKRCLAFGMFPGFFSHNASEGHYFTRPELYNRDRPLFKRYLPLCKRVAEAGWEPIPFARSSDPDVTIERFGNRLWTVFNASSEPKTAMLTFDNPVPATFTELLTGKTCKPNGQDVTLSLPSEDVAVLEAE